MFEVFVAALIEEVLPLLVGGYFRFAEAKEVRRWSIAAWLWLGFAMASLWCVTWLANPFVAGVAIGAGFFAIAVSVVCSASATILHSRRESL